MEITFRHKRGTRVIFPIVDGISVKPINLSDAIQELEFKDNSISKYYNSETKRLSPERRKLYRDIVKTYFKDKVPYKDGDAKLALFTGGGPASGKGAFTKNIDKFYTRDDNPVKIDADDIKNLLKQADTKDLEAKVNNKDTAYYHEESSALAKWIYNIAIKLNYPVLFDGTSAGFKSVKEKVTYANKYGYKTECRFNLSKLETVLNNSITRYEKYGRLVPLEQILNSHIKIANNLENIAKLYDDCKIYDNSNHKYELIGRSVNHKDVKALNNNFKYLTDANNYLITESMQDDYYNKLNEINKRKGW